jgi:hypothetical protein
VAAWVLGMFRNFYLAKNHKISNNSIKTEAKEKISTGKDSIEFGNFFDVISHLFKNIQI